MVPVSALSQGVIRDANDQTIADYYDRKKNSTINTPPNGSDLHHHHLGVGEFDHTVLDAAPGEREAKIMSEIHRMETAQVSLILDALGQVSPESRVLDAGSGRGGTSFMVHEKFGCSVDGVSLSQYQVDFATAQATERGCAEKVRFHRQNMCSTSFLDNSFDFVVANETDMYVNLVEAYQEFARILAPGGRFVFVTWCCNDVVDPYSPEARAIDENYPGSHTDARSLFFSSLAQARLAPIKVTDITAAPLPYLKLRAEAAGRTGVEKPYYDGFAANTLNYLVVAAERVIE